MDTNQPKSIGHTTVVLVHQDVVRLLAHKKTYRQLFISEPTVKLLNSVAPTTFGIFQDTLLQEMTLGITRTLLDPAVQGRYANLGLETIMTNMPGDHFDLLERLDRLREKYEPIRHLRRKVRAHRDEETAYSLALGEETEVFDAKVDDIFEAIDDIKRLMGDSFSRLLNGNPYDTELTGPDAERLIAALKRQENNAA